MNNMELLEKLEILDKHGELTKMYRGEEFDPNDEAYIKLLSVSEDLCNEYTALRGKTKLTEEEVGRKEEILSLLFPNHGILYGVGAGIHVIAGLVELGNNCYINSNVCFHPDVFVKTGEWFICAPNVTFGSKNKTNKVQDIIIENDVWIGADAKIARGARIGKGCVVAMGARVQEETRLNPMSVYGGNPAFAIRKIVGPQNDEGKEAPKLFWENLDFLKQYYISHGIVRSGDDFTEFENFLRGKKYNSLNTYMGAVNSYSHSVCAAYMLADSKKRESMMSELFPIMGTNCTLGKNLQLDAVGSVILGDNVHIGNNVTLMGNIKIGNDCEICDDVSIIAIGHDVFYIGRHVTMMDNCSYMKNTSGYVIVDDEIHIHSGAKILASQIISEDVEANILLLNGNKKIRL